VNDERRKWIAELIKLLEAVQIARRNDAESFRDGERGDAMQRPSPHFKESLEVVESDILEAMESLE
jgi:hypothetical protein